MKYHAITANSSSELDKKVNDSIAAGWMPQGGVATSEGYLWQAMVKAAEAAPAAEATPPPTSTPN